MPLASYAQNFINPGLEDTIAISSSPDDWTTIPHTDAINMSTGALQSIPDVCGSSGPSIVTGIRGNPNGGNTFVSGLYGEISSATVFHEGIEQNVTGLDPTQEYQISFYQTVVKQINAIDTSGSWDIYMDNVLLTTSKLSVSHLPFSSNNLVWDYDTINFFPTATSHTFKFIPSDDDTDRSLSTTDSSGALRMGIDDINLAPLVDCFKTLDIGNDTILCTGDSLSITITGFNDFSFLWSNTDTNSFTKIYSPGTYWVQADSSLCTYYDTIVITNPINNSSILGNDTTLCVNDSITLDATSAGATYLWNDASTDSVLHVGAAGQYFVDITASGCLYTDSIQISYFTPPIFDLGNDTSLCQSASITLDAAVPGASYLWHDNSIMSTINISAPEDTVSVILSQNNCQYYDTIVIDYFPVLSDFLGNDTMFCSTDSIQFNLQLGASSYLWSNGSTDSSTTFYVADTVWLEVIKNGCTSRDSLIMTNHPIPSLNLGNDTTLCIYDSIILDATYMGASYLWNDNSINPTLTVHTSGQYYVDLTTADGCLYSDSIQVDYYTPPVFDLGNDTSLCQLASITLDATTPGVNYLWDNASILPTRTINSEDTVSIILTQNNCQYYDTIVITYYPEMTDFLGNDTIFCMGDSIELDPQLGASNYFWSNGFSDSSTIYYLADTVWLDIIKYGCSYSDTMILTNYPIISFNIGNDTTLCLNDSIVLDATTTGASYLWNDNTNAPTLTVHSTGQYYVDITTVDGCSYSDSIQIDYFIPPNFDLGNDTSLCQSASITLDATTPGASYLWNDNSILSTITVATEDTISIILTQNNCEYHDTIIIDFVTLHQPNLGSDTSLCPGDSIILFVPNTNANILWSNQETDSAVTIYNQSQVWVELSDNGCTASDTIIVDYFNSPSVNLGPDTSLCENQSISWNITQNGATYLWHDNSTAPTYSTNQSELVFVTLTDINLCKAYDTVQVEKILLDVELGPDLLLCENDSVEVNVYQSSNTQYLWNDNSSNASLVIKSPGLYFVTVTELSCLAKDSITVDFSVTNIDFDTETIKCELDDIRIENLTEISSNDNIQSYYWDFGNGKFSDLKSPTISYTVAGLYDVTLTVESTNGCISELEKSEFITVNDKPSANFNYGIADRGAIEIEYFFESLSNSADNWAWYIDNNLISSDSMFNHIFNDYSSFKKVTLVVYSDNNCGDSLSQFIEIDENSLVYVPNAFTPFSSGNLNSVFKPIVTTGINDNTYHLMIFNRWGEIIFESKNPEFGWDGTYQGRQMPIDAYVWLLKFEESVSDQTRTLTGNVTIIR